ncbi:hypothetical protein NPIL_634541 [Nephila pilipes]|uniref:CCHC-type domain-containing protein n=1 Tax=Nephila pilipes TaxID=299642 RepID=A0A8X6TB29_NEPPI|nr:hypothetical protein NPIL_634541 [Nephila pilipes]
MHSPIRANFTKRFNVLITTLNEENLNREDIEIKLCSLERIARDLAECDDSICNALVDAKSEEYDKIEEYREKLDVARFRVKAYIEKLYPISESQEKSGFDSTETLKQRRKSREVESPVPTANDLIYGAKILKSCLFCGKVHNSQDCFKDQRMSFEEKQDILKKNKACFVCLKVGHVSRRCKSIVLIEADGRREVISLKDPKPTPVLVLLWDKSEDVLFCDNSFVETPPDTITRRVILSYANRVFDPIDFTCSVSLQPKILLQESWRSKVSWDSEVSTDMKKTFLKWIKDIKMLHLVKIPRKFLIGDVLSSDDADGGVPDLDKLDTTDVKGRLKYQQSLRQREKQIPP